MSTLFDLDDRQKLLARLAALRPESPRLWGKMDGPQMLAHCTAALAIATGDVPGKQSLIGRLLGPLVRRKVLGDQPFDRNMPTSPHLVIRDPRDLEIERRRLRDLVERFAALGPESAGRQTHLFFGRITGEEWGRLMHKHIDHHLRQFSS